VQDSACESRRARDRKIATERPLAGEHPGDPLPAGGERAAKPVVALAETGEAHEDAVRKARAARDGKVAAEEGQAELDRQRAVVGLRLDEAKLDQGLVGRAADGPGALRGLVQGESAHAMAKQESDFDRERCLIAYRALERLTLDRQEG
jgi:hypothetical protein